MKRFVTFLAAVLVGVAMFTPSAIAATQTRSGSGDQAVGPIRLSKGLAVIRMATGQTSSNYIVWLETSGGRKIELLANVVGSYNGSRAVRIPKTGKYYLNVTSDTNWRIVVSQSRPKTAPSTRTFRGTGPRATSLFKLSRGSYTFSWSGRGDSNFIVWLLDKNGNRVDLVCNKIGATKGSKRVRITSTSQYIMDIDADAGWTIRAKRR